MNHLSSTPAVIVALAWMGLTGVLLARSAPDYSTLLINAHKLGLLLLIVAVILRARASHLNGGLPEGATALLVTTGVIVVLTVVTGGLVSALASPPSAILIAHRLLPFAVLATSVVTVTRIPTPVQ